MDFNPSLSTPASLTPAPAKTSPANSSLAGTPLPQPLVSQPPATQPHVLDSQVQQPDETLIGSESADDLTPDGEAPAASIAIDAAVHTFPVAASPLRRQLARSIARLLVAHLGAQPNR